MITNSNNSKKHEFSLLFLFRSGVHPMKSPTQNLFFYIIFYFEFDCFEKKWIILINHSPFGNFLEAGNSQNPLCWIRTTSQVAMALALFETLFVICFRLTGKCGPDPAKLQKSGFCEFPASRNIS